MKAGIAVVAGLVLALVAFRRARGVLTVDARRTAARENIGLGRVAVGVAALVGIVWLARELFT